ncbi:DUF58 domain-containing protein [Natrinema salaciae]|uniref:Conserved repeat domain-containing protein n=1 Tax=Natrinema salaciae TaxID=1186196 RepID=A0A1H9Q2R1_9EURY|nr:DUF58 domain-containing protein [Natrinema salaciae]SER54741.1 conserved repeat domain-containing protein [Natrinema salaciae]
MTGRTVDRLDGGEWAIAATLVFAGFGLVVGSQLLVVAATLPLWYVAAAVFGTEPDTMLDVRRRITVSDGSSRGSTTDDGEPARSDSGVVAGDPGETVTVRTTVRNAGSDTIVDLRVVDGVPDAVPVVSGSPRTSATLEPLAETTLEYEVELRRGEYAFDDPTVRARDLTGTMAETWRPSTDGDDAIRCSSVVESVPLGDGTNDYAGEVPTDEGGSGVEFYSVRDYEPGDPVGSIDWRRYAGTRELATVEYRAERATRIVCVVDARSSQFRAATTAHLPAIERSVAAAERTFEALVDAGHPTGIVGIYADQLPSVAPGTDPATRREASRVLDALRDSERVGYWPVAQPDTDDFVTDLPRRLPGEAQVYLFSSFVDDDPVELVAALRARGYAVRVVSPAVTAGETDIATRLEALDRGTRLARARSTGARVIDWERERSLGVLLRDAIGEVRTR